MEKHLRVNTAIMDMISTEREAIEAYDSIRINCALCLATAKTRQFLSQGRITVNTANIIDVDVNEDVEVVTINGLKKITAEFAAPKKPTICIVNGGLIIEDSAKKNLDQYKNIILNGVALHPMSFDTSNFNVNGAMIPYPDGAKLILQEFELTNSFIKSAAPGKTYYVQGIPSDFNGIGNNQGKGAEGVIKKTGLHATEKLDLELLKSKNIRFYTGWITTLEENAEQLMEIADGFIGNTIIPAGYEIMQGGILDSMSVRRFGKRIYVDGDLKILEESIDALNALEQLIVTGNVCVADGAADIFFEKCKNYGELTVFKGELIDIEGMEYTIDKEFLESLENVGTFNFVNSTVQIHKDVTPELLSKKLYEIFLNESMLTISLNQQNTLRKLIRNNNSSIEIREHESLKQPEPEPEKKNISETVINSAYYKL